MSLLTTRSSVRAMERVKKQKRVEDDDNDEATKSPRFDEMLTPKLWFLLSLTESHAANVPYRAPFKCASVQVVKQSIALCRQLDANSKFPYPDFQVGLGCAISGLLEGYNDDELAAHNVVGGHLMLALFAKDRDITIPDGMPTSIDLTSIVVERALWEALDGEPTKFKDLLSDWSDSPTDVYQICTLDTWC